MCACDSTLRHETRRFDNGAQLDIEPYCSTRSLLNHVLSEADPYP